MKIQILERCPYCEGVSMVFVAREKDYNDEPYDRFRPCSMCKGSGQYPRWISLADFSQLLQQVQCPHEHTSTRGGMQFTEGEVWDDLTEVCDDCGGKLDI